MERKPIVGFRSQEGKNVDFITAEKAVLRPQNFIRSMPHLVEDLRTSSVIEFFDDAKSLMEDFLLAGVEHARLHMDPTFLGYKLPKGEGQPYIFLGGLGSSPVHYWDKIITMRALGYDAHFFPWGLINLMPPAERAKQLMPYIRNVAIGAGRKVIVEGHSLGGYGWAATFAKYPDEFVDSVEHVVFDGSPRLTGINRALELVYLVSKRELREDEFELADKASLLKEAEDAGEVKVTSIGSSTDPAVRGEMFGNLNDHYVIEGASHGLLATNRHSLKIIAHRLAGLEPDLSMVPNVHKELIAA